MIKDDRTLRWLLKPVERWMTDSQTTDFCINAPHQAWVKQRGVWAKVATPYSLEDLEAIGLHSAGLRGRDVWTDVPMCECTSPWGHRVYLVQEPCVLPGTYCYAARRPGNWQPTVDELERLGVLDKARQPDARGQNVRAYEEPRRFYLEGNMPNFYRSAVRNGLTIMAAGKMGSGKTTCVRGFFGQIDDALRVCSIEDEDEAKLTQPNKVGFLYAERGQGQADVGPEDLMKGVLRGAFDACMVQELRGGEAAWAFLRMAQVIQTMTTNHGDSCYGAFDATRLMLKASRAGSTLSDVDIFRSLNRYVDVVVHCDCAPSAKPGGQPVYSIDEVWFRGADKPLGLTEQDLAA